MAPSLLFTQTRARIEAGEFRAVPYTTTRHLVVVLMETGLRGGEPCTLPFTRCSMTAPAGLACARTLTDPALPPFQRAPPR